MLKFDCHCDSVGVGDLQEGIGGYKGFMPFLKDWISYHESRLL
jgi:hypothetical protein